MVATVTGGGGGEDYTEETGLDKEEIGSTIKAVENFPYIQYKRSVHSVISYEATLFTINDGTFQITFKSAPQNAYGIRGFNHNTTRTCYFVSEGTFDPSNQVFPSANATLSRFIAYTATPYGLKATLGPGTEGTVFADQSRTGGSAAYKCDDFGAVKITNDSDSDVYIIDYTIGSQEVGGNDYRTYTFKIVKYTGTNIIDVDS